MTKAHGDHIDVNSSVVGNSCPSMTCGIGGEGVRKSEFLANLPQLVVDRVKLSAVFYVEVITFFIIGNRYSFVDILLYLLTISVIF